MKVLRTREMDVEKFEVGDVISVTLNGFGTFTATAQKITTDGTIFMFDNCVARHRMNECWTNEGGYYASEMDKWIDTELFEALPEELKSSVEWMAVPTYGQIFGHDKFHDKYLIKDEDEQFPLMKDRKNRIANFNNEPSWYWLRNATNEKTSSEDFAYVHDYGYAGCYHASYEIGVRPVFLLR